MGAKTPTSKAAELLRQTEQQFQELISEASNGGRYSDVVRLASVAEDIGQLTERLSSGEGKEAPSSSQKFRQSSPKKKSRKPRKSASQRKYPKFFRSGEELIKVGWSKKKKDEYRHTAPRRLALPLTKAIVQAGGTRAKVPTSDFFPIEDPKDNSEVPSYQSYIVLAWLVDSRIVEKHGRQGYTVPRPDSLRQQIEDQWASLAPVPS